IVRHCGVSLCAPGPRERITSMGKWRTVNHLGLRVGLAAAVMTALSSGVLAIPDFTYSRPKGARQPMASMPAEKPEPPEVKFGDFRPFNAIDNFILARLKEEKRTPKALCNDWDFLRRTSLDLAGVTPSADDVARFFKWPAKERRKRWIDMLLDQPQYAD